MHTLIALLAALLLYSGPSPRLVYTSTTCRDADVLLHFYAYGADGQSLDKVHIEVDGQPATLPVLPKTVSGDTFHIGATFTGHPVNPVVTAGAEVGGQAVALDNPGHRVDQCATPYVLALPLVAN